MCAAALRFLRMTGHPRAVLGDGRRSYSVMTEQGQTGTGYSIRSGSHDNTAGSDCHLSRWRQATFSGALVSIDRHRPSATTDGYEHQRLARVARADLRGLGCAVNGYSDGAARVLVVCRHVRHD